MKNRVLGLENRICPHCKIGKLSYYMESGQNDLYYCDQDYKLTEWNGERLALVDGEAYPNRNK